jgi:hypothetical protein
MKIKPVIKELPRGVHQKVGQYNSLWAAVVAADGDWVPVECASSDECRLLQRAATALRRPPGMQTRSDVAKLTIYIALRAKEPEAPA